MIQIRSFKVQLFWEGHKNFVQKLDFDRTGHLIAIIEYMLEGFKSIIAYSRWAFMLWIWSANWFHAQVCNQKPISQKLSPCWIRLGSSMTDLILPNIYIVSAVSKSVETNWATVISNMSSIWIIVWIQFVDSIKARIVFDSRFWYSEFCFKIQVIFF